MDQQSQPANVNPFQISNLPKRDGALAKATSHRAAEEFKAAMVMAKNDPRDEVAAWDRIMRACQRKSLAEQAIYVYPRGGTSVQGPSIRLAEAIIQAWGNAEFGIKEIEQRDGESTVEAFAHDLETNTRQVKIFQVAHSRYTKANGNVPLTDPRDVYEQIASQGARRLRACILGIIPGDVVEAAVEQCEKTMRSGEKEPLIDRVKKMAAVFGEQGVSIVMIEKKLGHKLDATIEQELVNLRKIYSSIRDGMASREQFFEFIQDPSSPQGINADEQAESDAGLAPAPAPASSPQAAPAPVLGEPRRRGRPPKSSYYPAQPAPVPAPTAPVQPASDPQPSAPGPATDPAAAQPTAKIVTAKHKLRAMLFESEIYEEHFVSLMKRKNRIPPDSNFFTSVPEEVCAECLKNWDAIFAELKA